MAEGRLVNLGLGTLKNTDGWPEVKQPANMGRVAALLGVTEGYLRQNGVGPFHKTYLPEEPGKLVYAAFGTSYELVLHTISRSPSKGGVCVRRRARRAGHPGHGAEHARGA